MTFSNYASSIAFPPMGAVTIQAVETQPKHQEDLQAGEFQTLKKAGRFAVLVNYNAQDSLFHDVFKSLMNNQPRHCQMQIDKGKKQEYYDFVCFGAEDVKDNGGVMIRFWLVHK